MSVAPLVPNHTGKSVYTTPQQSPTALHIYDHFANPEGKDDRYYEEKEESSEQPLTNGIHPLGQNGVDASTEPEVPPRPTGHENPFTTEVKKEAPQLPARPPSQPVRLEPKPTPNPPSRPVPTPLRQRIILPPPTITEHAEEDSHGSLKYTREPHKLIAYLIPLPKPVLTKNTENENVLPDRFLIYTPPQPHFLKPAKGVKEPKKHWCKRKLQEEVQKAKKYDGKTASIRGLHKVDEIVRVTPSSSTHTIPQTRDEFIAQVTRTKKKATKDAAISSFLLPITLVIDTFAAVIWPFGGLFEIDAVWAYASIKGWNTSRVITKRLGARDSVFGKYGGKERDLFLRFHQDEKMDVLSRYLAEACHKKNPKMFDSAGVPPTETEVMKAIGWEPVVRGKTGGMREEGETGWADEEWQVACFKNDFKATIEKGAGAWAKWCEKFEKSPEKALKK